MSRAPISYADAAQTMRQVYAGVDVTEPVAGFYRLRLRSGGIRGVVRLWNGPPHDPVTGEEMDRSWRWQAEFNGEPIEFDQAWPLCAGEPVSEREYRIACNRQTWAREHAPQSAYADPRARLDPLSASTPLPF